MKIKVPNSDLSSDSPSFSPAVSFPFWDPTGDIPLSSALVSS